MVLNERQGKLPFRNLDEQFRRGGEKKGVKGQKEKCITYMNKTCFFRRKKEPKNGLKKTELEQKFEPDLH